MPRKPDAWRVPKAADREPGVLYVQGVYADEVYESASAIVVNGYRFEKTERPGAAQQCGTALDTENK